MPDAASREPIAALTDWWEAMGVSVDTAFVEACLAAAPVNASRTVEAAIAATPRSPQTRHSSDSLAQEASRLAAACDTLDALARAIRAFEGSPLKAGSEQAVVFDGVPGASLMVIGEGPGAEEDRRGLPFVGKAGQLLDRMLAAIGRSRETNTFITNVNYWRPPGNRNPEPDELAICRPFVDRMIALARPKLIVAAGGVPASALLGRPDGIMKLRGTQHAFAPLGGVAIPLIPILHPAYLLRRPEQKSRAWRDLLLIEQRLATLGH